MDRNLERLVEFPFSPTMWNDNTPARYPRVGRVSETHITVHHTLYISCEYGASSCKRRTANSSAVKPLAGGAQASAQTLAGEERGSSAASEAGV